MSGQVLGQNTISRPTKNGYSFYLLFSCYKLIYRYQGTVHLLYSIVPVFSNICITWLYSAGGLFGFKTHWAESSGVERGGLVPRGPGQFWGPGPSWIFVVAVVDRKSVGDPGF